MLLFYAAIAVLIASGIYREGLRGFFTLPEDEERTIW